jgi:MYXO-CTERM domain-containing protein
MIRLTVFIIALLLVSGAAEPGAAWLVTLAVLSGLELVRRRPFRSGPRVRAWTRPWIREYDW